MQRAREARDELPDDFYIPMALDAPNLTALSPFLVPQTHLGSPGVFRGMAAFMLALIALGGPINALTIACTARYKKLRSHLNYILVNLAAANLLVICVGSTTAFYSFSQMYFALGPTACKIEGFAATLGGMVSLWSLAVVAFERFLVICKPLGNFTFRGSHAVLGCAATWIFGLVAAVPPLFGWSRYIPEGLQCSCGPDWYTANNKWNNESYVIFLFCFCFGVPLALIVFSYGRLLLTLRAVARQQEQSASTQKACGGPCMVYLVYLTYTIHTLQVARQQEQSASTQKACGGPCMVYLVYLTYTIHTLQVARQQEQSASTQKACGGPCMVYLVYLTYTIHTLQVARQQEQSASTQKACGGPCMVYLVYLTYTIHTLQVARQQEQSASTQKACGGPCMVYLVYLTYTIHTLQVARQQEQSASTQKACGGPCMVYLVYLTYTIHTLQVARQQEQSASTQKACGGPCMVYLVYLTYTIHTLQVARQQEQSASTQKACGGPCMVYLVYLTYTIHTLQVARQQEQSASTQKAEREVTKMVVVMVLGFLVCWAPYSAFALWVVTHRGRPFDVGLASIPSVFSKASTVYNPVIYVFMNKQFRSCMLKLLFCGRSPFGDEDDVSGSSQATQVSSVGSASASQVAPA
nr:blue-sensitive opsin isoform X2 [Columba livia]